MKVSGSGTPTSSAASGRSRDTRAAVHEEIDSRAIDELEAAVGDVLPVVGGNALAHDAAGHRDELQVEILDAKRVDLLADCLMRSARLAS